MGRNLNKVEPVFWKNKRVFITGHTGFKGSWLTIWLQNMGAVVKGYSLPPNTRPNLYTEANVDEHINSEIGDIRDLDKISYSMRSFNPDVVIHMAAQPLVRLSYYEPVSTYTTNVIGTVNVLEAARQCEHLKAIVCVTTDKCYENREWHWGYREYEPMGGKDPYSSSKGCAELVIAAYRYSYFSEENTPSLASVRAGNVIGGGDWSSDRLIPDILRALEKKESLIIRNPTSTRPWQHVLEPLSGYLVLAQNLCIFGDEFSEGWNFGPKDEDCRSVQWILDEIKNNWVEKLNWVIENNQNLYEAKYLKLDCSKAMNRLQWEPKWELSDTVKRIISWHKVYIEGGNLKQQCLNEIKDYMSYGK